MCHHIENIVPKYNRLWVFNDHVSRFISAKETCIFISCLCALLSIHHGVRHHDLVCMTLFLFIVVFIIMILNLWLCFFSPLFYGFIFCLLLLCLIMFYSPMVFIIISCPSSSNPSLFPPLFKDMLSILYFISCSLLCLVYQRWCQGSHCGIIMGKVWFLSKSLCNTYCHSLEL